MRSLENPIGYWSHILAVDTITAMSHLLNRVCMYALANGSHKLAQNIQRNKVSYKLIHTRIHNWAGQTERGGNCHRDGSYKAITNCS